MMIKNETPPMGTKGGKPKPRAASEDDSRTVREFHQKFTGTANCTRCGREFPVEDLTAILVRFQVADKTRASKKSVTAAKLCPDCLVEDEHWGNVWKMGPQWR